MASSRVDQAVGGFLGDDSRSLKSFIVNGIDASVDSVYQILDNVSDMLGVGSNRSGQLIILTERPACTSCLNAWGEFGRNFQNMDVQVYNNGAVGLLSVAQKFSKGRL